MRQIGLGRNGRNLQSRRAYTRKKLCELKLKINLKMTSSNAFQFIQPYCIQVAKMPSVENIAELQKAVSALDLSTFAEKSMLEYLIFPLKLTLQRTHSTKENIIIISLDCMASIFSNIILTNNDLFMDMFDTCCMLMSSKKHLNGKELLENSSEELKSSIINLLSEVLKQSQADTFCNLYSERSLPRLGHAVSLLLAICEFEKEKHLRLKSLQCLTKLTGDDKKLPSRQKKLSSAVFCSFIPGISITLSRIIINDPNIGQPLYIAIIETWEMFLMHVMKDKNFKFLEANSAEENISERMRELKSRFIGGEERLTVQHNEEKEKLSITRDQKWLENTQSKLNIILAKFLPLISQNKNARTRLAAISFISKIMKNCKKSMSNCLPKSVEVLAGLLKDDYEEVSKEAFTALQIGQELLNQGNQSLSSVIEDSLYESLLSLPRIMRSADDKKKLTVLNSLLGYITFLGSQIAKIFNSLTMLEKLVKAFLQALELNVNDIKIVEEKSILSSEEISEDHSTALADMKHDLFEQRFKNFNDAKILRTIKHICRAIGKFSDLQVIVDYQLEIFLSSSLYRKEAVLLLNEILIGRAGLENEQGHSTDTKDNQRESVEFLSSIVDQVISTYLSEEFWYLPTSNIKGVNSTEQQLLADQLELVKLDTERSFDYWEKGISFEQLNSNIQLICLLMEGIDTCSALLKDDFKVFLIKVLYPILEKHGNENAQIARSAHNALLSISRNCKEPSVADLITNNADYIINAISMSFRHLTLFSSAPCVLSVVLAYCNADILPLVTDVLEDVFYCLDTYQDDIVFSLMKVLRSLANSVKEWFADKETDHDTSKKNQTNKRIEQALTPAELRDFLSQYCKLKLEALGAVDEESLTSEQPESSNGNNEEIEKDEKKIVPPHFKAIITTLEKCQHFLPSKDMNLKLLVLDVIELGVKALRCRKDDLLPAIHTHWPSIVLRLKEQQTVIITRTLEVICVMIDASEDFMRQRICKDFLPVASEYLKNQLKISEKSSSLYKFSHACKLQAKLINLIGSMVVQLELTDKDLAIAATCCSAYLDCKQPHTLQIAAINAMKKMKTIDSGYIWLLLVSLYSPQKLKSKNSSFKDVPHLPKTLVKNEFTDNVMKVIQTMVT